MTTKENNLDSIALGAIISSGTTSSGDTLTLSKSGSATSEGTATAGELIHGAKSLALIAASSEISYAYWAWTSVAAVGVRFAIRLTTLPGGTVDLLDIRHATGGTSAARVRMSSAGQVTVKDYEAAATIYTCPTNYVAGDVVQFDLSVDPGTGSGDGACTFAAYDEDGGWALGMSSAYSSAAVNMGTANLNVINFGRVTASAWAFTTIVDSFKSVDAYGLIGPLIEGVYTPFTVHGQVN